MVFEQTAAGIAVALSLGSNVLYIRRVAQGKIKPHMFTWFVWGLVMMIGAAAQYSDNAGVGAAATGFGGAMCLIIAGQAFFTGEKNITQSDWIAFIAALLAIPLWYFTAEALTAVILISLIDVLGAFPTFRKSYSKPYEEGLFMFVVSAVICFMRLLAIEHYSLTTTLYMTVLVALNFALIVMLIVRRRIVGQERKGAIFDNA